MALHSVRMERIAEAHTIKNGYLQLFIYLQVLDLLTTLVGFRTGAAEASPFVCLLMQAGPECGVVLAKLLAFALVGMCIYLNRRRVVRWISYWYAGLVVWNLCIILVARPQ